GERERLWQIEHHGNLLVKHGFGPFADALKRGDAEALTRLFAADFAGEAPDRPRETRLRTGLLDVVRHGDDGNPPARLGRDAFAALLLDYRRLFARPPGVKLSLMGLSPEDAANADGRWQGTGLLRLWGEREPGKPGEVIVTLQYRLAK